MSGIAIKSDFEGDVRRLSVTDTSFDKLKNVLCNLYGLPDLVVKYADEENELITMASDPELAEAVSIAKGLGQKALRLKVSAKPTPAPAAAAEAKADKPDKAARLAERAAAKAERESEKAACREARKAEREAKRAERGTEGRESRPRIWELKRAALSLLADPKAVAALPAALEAALAVVDAAKPLSSKAIIEAFLGAAPDIAAHEALKRFQPHWEELFPRIDAKLARRVSAEQVAMFKGFLPTLLPVLPVLLSELPGVLSTGGGLAACLPALAPFLGMSAGAGEPSDAKTEAEGEAVHSHVRCDGCGAEPIRGIRYKCSVCRDYDLCEACEARNAHPEHALLKIRQGRGRGHGGHWRAHGPHGHGHHGWGSFARRLFGGGPGRHCHGGKHGRPQADYVKDTNLPDGADVSSGSQAKTWVVRNSGPAAWPEGVHVMRVGGATDVLSAPETAVKAAAPGEEVEITVPLTLPAKPGRYTVHFRLATKEGVRFGPRLWLDLNVKAAAAVAATPEAKQAEPTPAAAAAAAASPLDGKWALQLSLLASMGFGNPELNTYLLEKHQGNLQAVAEFLLTRA